MRSSKLVVIALAAAAVALVIVYAPIAVSSAERLLVWLTSESEAGSALIEPGDRYADVEFDLPFASPPVVTLTPEVIAHGLSFAVVRVDGDSFRVEVSQPAPTTLAFSWNAVWNVGFELEDADDRGLPTALTANVYGEEIDVAVEAYRDGQPAALLVPRDSLGDLDDDAAADAALAAARDMFRKTFTCSWLDELRYRIYARAASCPAWGTSAVRPTREWSDPGAWSVRRTERGLEIALPGGAPSVDRASVIAAWSDLLRGASAFDLSRHNNQVLDFVDELTRESRMDPAQKLTIIHFDTHSDLHTYPDPTVATDREDISDFMNRLAKDGRLVEVYWVLPEWTREPGYRETYWDDALPDEPTSYVEGPNVLEIFADASRELLYFGAPPKTAAAPGVRFHKVLLDELPSFEGRTDVYLEIDGDYFSNTGFDTALQGHASPTIDEMLADVARVADALRARGVRPLIASWCLSPAYTSYDDEIEQERFVLDVIAAAAQEDYVLGYRHLEASGAPARSRTVRRDTPLGRLLLEIRGLDLQRADADRRIDLAHDEAAAVLDAVSNRLALDATEARALLRRLDRFDGRLDGVVDLDDVEYYAAIDDVERVLDRPTQR